MPLLNAYDPCPCASGQKYKWCCFQASAFIDRFIRYAANDQIDAADKVLDEGLAKFPDNAFLLVQQAILLLSRREDARPIVDRLLALQPNNPHGLAYRIGSMFLKNPRIHSDLIDEIGRVIRTLSAAESDYFKPIYIDICSKVKSLAEVFSLLKSLRIALDRWKANEAVHTTLTDCHTILQRGISFVPWVQCSYELADPTDDLTTSDRECYLQAINDAHDANFLAAESVFDEIAERRPSANVYWNAALVKLWRMDVKGGTSALVRHIELLDPESDDAIDAEALLQSIYLDDKERQAEGVYLTWPLRDRDRLLALLDDDPTFAKIDRSRGSEDQTLENLIEDIRSHDRPDAEAGEEIPDPILYVWFDRPVRDHDAIVAATFAEAPTLCALVIVERDKAGLGTFDDERLASLIDRFREIAGATIPPAQPRTTSLGKRDVFYAWKFLHSLIRAMKVENEPMTRLSRLIEKAIVAVWTPLVLENLVGRRPKSPTDLDARSRRIMRAVLKILEHNPIYLNIDFSEIHARLGSTAEAEFDASELRVDTIQSIPIYDLIRVPVAKIDDNCLIASTNYAQNFMHIKFLLMSYDEILRRPGPLFNAQIKIFAAAQLSINFQDFDHVEEVEPLFERLDSISFENADEDRYFRDCVEMLRISFAIRNREFATAIPKLLELLDRIDRSQQTRDFCMSEMIRLGLMRVSTDPESGEPVIDPTIFIQLATAYAPRVEKPRVVKPSVAIDIEAGRKTIWTPGSDEAGTGERKTIWTPGSSLR
jgi:hypothetical protein